MTTWQQLTLPEPLSTLAPRQPTIVISRVAKSRVPARSIHKRRDDSLGIRTRLAVDAALAGTGIIHLFEDWLQPHLACRLHQHAFFIAPTFWAATCRRQTDDRFGAPRDGPGTTDMVKVSGCRPSQVARLGAGRRTETAHVRTRGQ